MTNTLCNAAKSYLETQKGKWPALCKETGLDYNWLTRFAQGRIKDPSANKVEKILRHGGLYPFKDTAA